MTPEQEGIKRHRELIALLKANLAREGEASRQRIEKVKAEERQRLALLYSRARISSQASFERNLPPGYVRNSDSIIPEFSGGGY
jgi:hypothetical protein